jgi:hypothetical protein
VQHQLLDVYGIFTTVAVALPRPLAALVRGWVDRYRHEDITTSLDALVDALDTQSRR